MRSKYLFFILLILASCNNNKKTASTVPLSIYKIWQFKKMDTTATSNRKSAVWIGDNSLDMTNRDTLRFSYGNTNNKPTAYPYMVSHDTILIGGKPAYKILKLTDIEMDLMVAFKNNGKQNAGKDSVVMIYHSK